MEKYILIDIGGSQIKHGILEDEKIIRAEVADTNAQLGGKHILNTVLGLIEEKIRYEEGSCFEGVCISSAGMVDPEKGEIFHSGPTIPDYKGINFINAVKERFSLHCEIENDVNCAALAEYMSGAGCGAQSLLCMTIGTGIGGCFIEGGKVLHGFSNSACEIGYMKMKSSDLSFEELASSGALSKRVAELKDETVDKWSGIRIFEELYKGDKDCMEEVELMCRYLAEGISNIVYVLNPEVVVLGGGIMQQKEYLLPRIGKYLNETLISVLAENIKISAAQNGNNAGMLGAYYHFRQRTR